VELSQYVLEVLRRDEEFVLYRGEPSNQPCSPSVLLLSLASMTPALETLKKIEYEYSFRGELDSAWAIRSPALAEHRGQMTLVLEDSGGETLDRFPRQLPGLPKTSAADSLQTKSSARGSCESSEPC